MKTITTLLILTGLLITTKGMALERDPWRAHEFVLQSAVIATTTYDLMQTYKFLYVTKDASEANPFMGQYPTKTRFFIVGGGWMVLHTAISHYMHYLPNKINRILIPVWQSFWIGEEISSIHHNYKGGVRILF
jgi:hypothetical protein